MVLVATISPANAHVEMIDYTFLLPGKNDGRYLAGPGAIHGRSGNYISRL